MNIELMLKAGKDATPEERAAFKELVLRDPQVDPKGLSGRIAQAYLLAFLYKDGELIATGAIKNNSWHQEHVAEDAGVPLPSAEYLGEVGYIHTAEGHRRHGHGDRVLASLAEAAGGKELFATIQSKNKLSQRLLARNGYVRVGKSWPSNRVDDRVNLYIRPKAAPKAGG
ncbi:GNAT family N-acetyltransferase [Mesorhizobium sp.]|uniref:GNAT family N-acetyltransferase n=1 Tax=Mesorhizobium sp. TaxID=1871066 RepID=UPI000FE9A294|nr:GNAT family N-acetyltransferase [Mesorhizobium sp.]RWF83654.1 MAG: GNAT family N-acetyltransferase [Mesorhizobium sp.]RWF88505.1 MAG: GNAT family N-acetyltransferase [Mesorhizobium sp.]TIM54120.1 MAG: GNAT family N-acetyltransferase [Mesorhizobium sp.]